MRDKKKAFAIVYIQFLISAVSVWMVLGAFDAEGKLNTLGYTAGVLFWLGILGGVIISLAATIFLVNRRNVNQIAVIMFIFLLVLSLYSHFLLNGKIFTAILIENKKGKGDSRE